MKIEELTEEEKRICKNCGHIYFAHKFRKDLSCGKLVKLPNGTLGDCECKKFRE